MFDVNQFNAAQLTPREARVPVPDLTPFFGDAEPVWIVRGLTGEQIARSNESGQRHAMIAATIQALANTAAAKSETVEALQSLMGYGSDVPEDLAKRFDHLVFGSVSPTIERSTAVRLFASYPIVAYTLTNKILELTGQGPDVGKSPHSTAHRESEAPSPSAT